MPRISEGGFSGIKEVKFEFVAADRVPPNEWRDSEAIRAVYTDDICLFVPVDRSGYQESRPFLKPGSPEQPITESYLKEWLRKDTIWGYARNGALRGNMAPPGVHEFMLHDMFQYEKETQYGHQVRVVLVLRTDDGLQCTLNTPYSIRAQEGATPDQDSITFSSETNLYKYLVLLGLDIEELEEAIKSSDGLWPREGVNTLFEDKGNVLPQLLSFVARHPNRVEIEIVKDADYGLSTKLSSITKIKGSGSDGHQFAYEVAQFNTLWSEIAKRFTADDNATFFNEDGTVAHKNLVLDAIVPIVHDNPWMVTSTKEDGSPAVRFPLSAENWNIDGLVILNKIAEELYIQHEAGKIDLSNPTGVLPDGIKQWVKDNINTGYEQEEF